MHKYLRLSRGMVVARSDYTEIYLLEKEVFPEVIPDKSQSECPNKVRCKHCTATNCEAGEKVSVAIVPPQPKIQIMVYPRSIEEYRKLKTFLKLTEIADVSLKMLEENE